MKIGVKTFDNPAFLRHFVGKVDFFEIMAIETNDYSFLKEFNLPIVIHSQHRKFDVNIADKNKEELNIRSLEFAKKIADQTNAKKIIVHPGELDDENCSIEQAVLLLKKINDKRLIVENLPPEGNYIRLGRTPEQLKELITKSGCGFCFDINHAIEAALDLKIDYLDFIREFLKLKPNHYHIGGHIIKTRGKTKDQRDHLAIKETDFDLKQILSMLPRDAEITLETTTDINATLEDVKIIRQWIKELNIN
jgi:deoxyribonuclease IV